MTRARPGGGSSAVNSLQASSFPKLSGMSDKPSNEKSPAGGTLEGTVPPLADPALRDQAMDLAFDYRGDVTIETVQGQVIEGYVFDRRNENGQGLVRIMPKDSDQRLSIFYDDIKRLVFSGRDTAAGKSWETWVKKYHEKKAKGEKASIESDPLV